MLAKIEASYWKGGVCVKEKLVIARRSFGEGKPSYEGQAAKREARKLKP